MVALNSDFAASKPGTDVKKRVGRFFSLAAESVGAGRHSSHRNAGEKRSYSYDTTSVDTEFEYGPFGELIRATGGKKDAFNFRFSTKYEDPETELLYYGYRYYNAETGRWLNRDLIEEDGGLNLYAYVSNNPMGGVDLFGLKEVNIWASAFIEPSSILFPYPPVAFLAEWHGDGRGFGPDQSARVWHKAVIETDPSVKSNPLVSNTSGAGSTSATYYDFIGVRRTDTATASSPAKATVTRDSSNPCLVKVKIEASSSNPLV
jgi:RHS repeat-associated protein